jgi:hypothetical protein
VVTTNNLQPIVCSAQQHAVNPPGTVLAAVHASILAVQVTSAVDQTPPPVP